MTPPLPFPTLETAYRASHQFIQEHAENLASTLGVDDPQGAGETAADILAPIGTQAAFVSQVVDYVSDRPDIIRRAYGQPLRARKIPTAAQWRHLGKTLERGAARLAGRASHFIYHELSRMEPYEPLFLGAELFFMGPLALQARVGRTLVRGAHQAARSMNHPALSTVSNGARPEQTSEEPAIVTGLRGALGLGDWMVFPGRLPQSKGVLQIYSETFTRHDPD